METFSLGDGRWCSVVRRISLVVDLDATSRRFGALRRVRKIRSAEGLLRLALMYGPGLYHCAVAAGDAGIASLSGKGVLGRLRQMGDWLEHVLQELLADQRDNGAAVASGGLKLSLVDGSVICGPAAQGSDCRAQRPDQD